MVNYALGDVNGKVLGVVTLFDDDIPKLIMNGVELILGGTFIHDENKFLNFTLIPVAAKEIQMMDDDKQPPVRVCCGQKHSGPVCLDGRVMCCLCFERVEQQQLAIDPEDKKQWDICSTCYEREMMF